MDSKIQKTYKAEEVNSFLRQVEESYQETLKKQKDKIHQLREELETVNKENQRLGAQRDLVSKAIIEATAKSEEIVNIATVKAEEIEYSANAKYNQQMAYLQRLHDKWMTHFDKILQKYPLNDELISTTKANAQISTILGKQDTLEEQFLSESRRLIDKERQLTPREQELINKIRDGKINEIFDRMNELAHKVNEIDIKTRGNNTSDKIANRKMHITDRLDSGFSFSEALKPNSDLKDIINDLGLLMDD